MKVVHISTTDYGGAYKAAARISESMNICGIDSEVLIRTKKYRETVGIEIFTNYSQEEHLLWDVDFMLCYLSFLEGS